jgi:hypothetical protein
MAEPRGRSGTWATAAVAAPVIAGMFAGLTAWATHEDPLHPSPTADASGALAGTPAATTTPDPVLTQLQQSLAADQARLDALARKVAAVRRQAAAAARAAKGGTASGSTKPTGTGAVTTAQRSSGSAGSSSSGSHSSSSGGGSATSAPAAAPPAAPSTHGSTGASGSG